MYPTVSVLKLNTLNFPLNCSIGVYNVNSQKYGDDSNKAVSVSRSKIAAFCAECKPGYKKKIGLD